ncbi:MAG TPA: replication-relaxation family protein [Solirubrobacterales bacterium]|nr:replication-relaxation family protein [Solirubrobacterales bacterium]
MSKRVTVQAALTETGTEVTASLAQHRVLSTAQVRAIHLPGRGERWTQRLLIRLEQAGLAGFVQAPRSHGRLWHATELGARLAREAGLLDGEPRLIGAEQAAGALQAHTLAVNDSAICFVEAARKRGDDFGPFAWHHEVAHPLSRGRGRRRRRLIADAVLTYLRIEKDGVAVEQRFLEIDRATLTVDRLAAELSRYAELYGLTGSDGNLVWRPRYPFFPPVHCVLAGGRRPALERRRATVLALLRSDPRLSRTPEVGISICLLDDLKRDGPFAPIFRDARDPERAVDWLGSGQETERTKR